MTHTTQPARAARERAGLSLEAAAKYLRVSPAYLRQCERSGQFAFHTAARLARRYGARLEDFLPTRPRMVGHPAAGAGGAGAVRKRPQPQGEGPSSSSR
ncbi:MAG: helix-turn-helix domain-containing protein [Actinomycetota bacterium]